MTDVSVKLKNEVLTQREQKFLEVLLLNLAAQSNMEATGKGMALNPLELAGPNQVLHYRFAWQTAIDGEQYIKFQDGIQRRFTNAFKMCDLLEAEISFKENAYAEQ